MIRHLSQCLPIVWVFLSTFLMAVAGQGAPSREDALGTSDVAAGSIHGSFAVQQGGVTYTLSLMVPPGLEGAQPSLSLVYGSGQDNGVLGIGFRLKGVSAITRCGSQIVSDGFKGRVAYGPNDRYCLNGQRLVEVDDGSYRTQLESRQRIQPAGTCGSGPCSFTLQQSDGTTLTFGLENGSAVLAEGLSGSAAGSVRAWMQDTLTDSNGNTVSFHYTQTPRLKGGETSDQTASGQRYLDQITYTYVGGPEESRAIQFLYEPRRDTLLEYVGGGVVQTALRLAQIDTSIRPAPASCDAESCPAQDVLTYRLDYEPAPTTGRSRLAAVTQCSALGDCLLPTRFRWTRGGNSFSAQDNPGTDLSSNLGASLGDFNGDGLSDILLQGSPNYLLYLASDQGFGKGQSSCIPDTASRLLFGDFNGDGTTDVYGTPDDNNEGTLYLGDSSGFGCACDNTCPSISNLSERADSLLAGDFNGDGQTDLAVWDSSFSQIYLSQGQSFAPSPNDGGGLDEGADLFVADFNGDGCADVLSIAESGDAALSTSQESNDSGSVVTALGTATELGLNLSGSLHWISDFNNDGLTDLLVGNSDVFPGSTSGYLYYGTGTGLAQGEEGLTLPLTEHNYVGEFNGDGLPDIFIADGRNSGTLYLGDGVDFACVAKHGTCVQMTPSLSSENSFLGDFNGDGLTDNFYAEGNQSVFDLAATDGNTGADNQSADMLEAIVDGYGGKTRIIYRPITDPSVYDPVETSAAFGLANLYHAVPLSPSLIQSYPFRALRAGQYVVARYEQTNDRAINGEPYAYSYDYDYTHSVLNLVGRGWMGYGTVTVTDPQLAAQTTTTYEQGFPFNARIKSHNVCQLQDAKTCNSDSQALLRSTTATWSCLDSQTSPPSQCNYSNAEYQQGATQVFFVAPNTTTDDDVILGSQVVTTFAFDEDGNLELLSELGDQNDSGSVPLYTCKSYFPADGTDWTFGFVQYRKKTTRSDCTRDISTWQDGDLQLLQFAYDDHGNRQQRLAWDNHNNIWLGIGLTFTDQGLPQSLTELSGRVPQPVPGSTYGVTYDPGFSTYPASITTPDPGSGAGPLTMHVAFDARFGTQVAAKDPNGNIRNSCLDGFGRPVTAQGPVLGGAAPSSNCLDSATYPYVDSTFTGNTNLVTTETRRYAYDVEARSMQVVQSGLNAWNGDWSDMTFFVDGLGRNVAHQYLNDQGRAMTAQTVYLDPQHVGQRSLPAPKAEHWVVFEYDALARLRKTTRPFWDIEGQPASSCDGTPGVVCNTVEYGSPNLMTVTQAAGTAEAVSQQQTLRYYGNQHRVRAAAVVGGGTTTYDFDGLARLIRVTQPQPASGAAVVDEVQFDSLGRVVRRSDTGSGVHHYHFDTLGRLEHKLDAMGQRTTYGWDPLHRQTSQKAHTMDGKLASTITVTYDVAAGSRFENTLGRAATTSVSRTLPFDGGTMTYDLGYDTWGRESARDVALAGHTFPFDIDYDPQGRPSARTYPKIHGHRPQMHFAFWESYGGLQSVDYAADGAPPTTWLQLSHYDGYGHPRLAEYGNGADERWHYFRNGLLSTHAVNNAEGQPLLFERFGWNANHHVQTILGSDPAKLAPPPSHGRALHPQVKTQYTYDLLRLSTVRNAAGTAIYCYDDAGNLVQSDGVVFTYSGNQVVTGATAQTPDQCQSAAGAQVFSAHYDRNGNMKARQAASTQVDLTFGVEGWLLQTEIAGKPFERFAYDDQGRRMVKTVFRGDGQTVDHVVLYPAPDFEVTLVHDGTAQATVYGTHQAGRFAARTETLALGDVASLAEQLGVRLDDGAAPQPGQILVFHLDSVGSTEVVTDTSGAHYADVDYDAWGTPTIHPTENDAFRPLFGGKEYTEETGLYYFDARYLDPVSGRFISADTQIAAPPLVPDAYNDYAYALNNPITYADPSGHSPVGFAIAGAVALVSVAVAVVDVAAAVDIDMIAEEALVDDLEAGGARRSTDFGRTLGETRPLGSTHSAEGAADEAAARGPETRGQKTRRYLGSLGQHVARFEAVNTGESILRSKVGSETWKGYGYSSGKALLDGFLGFGFGTTQDLFGGIAGLTSEREQLVLHLVKGSIQGAAVANTNRTLNQTSSHASAHHSQSTATLFGTGTGFATSFGAFGVTKAWSSFKSSE